jgi:quercetin dioxygenase-like cupin family protein
MPSMHKPLFACAFAALSLACTPPPRAPIAPASARARVISLGAPEAAYVELLGGPPASVSMESGVVALAPGATVGAHDTKSYEELVIPLEGAGELRVEGEPPLPLAPGSAAYTPPHTKHDVANTGTVVLRYIYVAAPTR